MIKFFGIPKESYAFSNNVFGALGSPPGFKDASFKLDGNMTVKIKMEAVSDVEITQKKFQEQADYFWESLDGKASYLKSSSKFEYTNGLN